MSPYTTYLPKGALFKMAVSKGVCTCKTKLMAELGRRWLRDFFGFLISLVHFLLYKFSSNKVNALSFHAFYGAKPYNSNELFICVIQPRKIVSSPRNNADGLRVAVVAAMNKSYNKASLQGFGLKHRSQCSEIHPMFSPQLL